MKDFVWDMDDLVNWWDHKLAFHFGGVYGYRLKCKGDCCDIHILFDE